MTGSGNMENLPTELLSHVFALTIPRDSYRDQFARESNNNPQATLSLVCRYWERVVVTTPQVWSYIHLSEETTEETLRRRLDLSGSERLDVRLNVGDDADADVDGSIGELYGILLGCVDRWRSFVIQGIVVLNRDLKYWIPKLLPNVVEAAYYILVEEDMEGLNLFDNDAEFRAKPWTVAPKLQRFAVKTSGHFHFKTCPLVTEFAVSEMADWWGGDEQSWHDKWEEYLTQLTKRCPQLQALEITGGALMDPEGHDPMGWTKTDTKWSLFPHLHTLDLSSLSASSMIPIFTKFNAPNLKNLHLGPIQDCLPFPLPSATFAIDPSKCRIHFNNSPLHAIKLFLEKVSHARELNVCIELADALEICADWDLFPDERGTDPAGLRARITEDWTWIKENTRSVQCVLPENLSGLFPQEEWTADSVTTFAYMGLILRPSRHMV